MAIVESLPAYGVHYYEVRDKHGTTWWLGLSPQGIAVYPQNDKWVWGWERPIDMRLNMSVDSVVIEVSVTLEKYLVCFHVMKSSIFLRFHPLAILRISPRRVYQWRQLENLYFREKKFSVEIHDQRKSNAPNQGGKSGSRTFGPSNVNVHVWFAATPTLCKTIWSMAICQHQFYLDRKTTKVCLWLLQTKTYYNVEGPKSLPRPPLQSTLVGQFAHMKCHFVDCSNSIRTIEAIFEFPFPAGEIHSQGSNLPNFWSSSDFGPSSRYNTSPTVIIVMQWPALRRCT